MFQQNSISQQFNTTTKNYNWQGNKKGTSKQKSPATVLSSKSSASDLTSPTTPTNTLSTTSSLTSENVEKMIEKNNKNKQLIQADITRRIT